MWNSRRPPRPTPCPFRCGSRCFSHDHCRNPIGNPFNVAFDTQMLVLCHNETILREWYSIKGDTVKIFDLAEWKGDEGFVLLTNLPLYDRRNNMEGIVLRAVSVKVLDKIRRAFLCGCVPKFIVSAKNLRYVHYIFSIPIDNFGTKFLYNIFSSTVLIVIIGICCLFKILRGRKKYTQKEKRYFRLHSFQRFKHLIYFYN